MLLVLWGGMQKTSRNSFQHSTAEKHRFILITAPFSRLKTVQMMIIFGNGSTSCHFPTRINGPTPGSVGAPRTRSTTYTYIPKNYPKLMKPTKIKCFGIWGSCFPFEHWVIFRFCLAQINCLARSPFVKPFPVTLG